MCAYNLSAGGEKTGGSQWLAGQSMWNGELQVQWETMLQNRRWRAIQEDSISLWPPCAQTRAQIHTKSWEPTVAWNYFRVFLLCSKWVVKSWNLLAFLAHSLLVYDKEKMVPSCVARIVRWSRNYRHSFPDVFSGVNESTLASLVPHFSLMFISFTYFPSTHSTIIMVRIVNFAN